MIATLPHSQHTDPAAESHRHAYNAAFDELGLGWHWDSETWSRVQGRGDNWLRSYLESQQAHLLRAYDADFLVTAIETTKQRCHACVAITRRHISPPAVPRLRPLAQPA